MLAPDVNILVNAFRPELEEHPRCIGWLEAQVNGHSDFGLIPNVLSGFLRVVTHPRIFNRPSHRTEALVFCQTLVDCEVSQWIGPGKRHWGIFRSLCDEADARGNLIPDAWFASVVIENGCEWVTLDRNYARFQGLRWRLPEA